MRPKIVRTPWSRRGVLAWTAGAVASMAALKLVVREAGSPAPGVPAAGPVDNAPPPALPTPVRPLTIAVPNAVSSVSAYHDEPVLDAVRRALPAASARADGRYQVDLLEIAADRSQLAAIAPLMGSGAPPDVILFTGPWSMGAPQPELASAALSRWLRPLDDYAKSDRTLQLGEFLPAPLDLSRHRGQLFGIPLQTAPMLLVSDRLRLREAGIGEPNAGWTWSHLSDAAAKLTHAVRHSDGSRHPGQYGLFMAQEAGGLLSLIWQNGGEAVSADRTRALLTERAALGAIEFFASLYRKAGGVALPPPPSWSAWALTHEQHPTVLPAPWWSSRWGETGMLIEDAWEVAMSYESLGGLRDVQGGRLAASELPWGIKRAAPVGVRASLTLTARSSAPDAAAAALFSLAEAATKLVGLPARRQSPATLARLDLGGPPPRERAALEKAAQAVTFSLEYGRAAHLGDMERSQDLHRVLIRLVTQLQYGALPPTAAAEAANRSAEQVLARL